MVRRSGFGPTRQWLICLRTLADGLILCTHRARGPYHLDIAGAAVR